jgi:hypothetical protein
MNSPKRLWTVAVLTLFLTGLVARADEKKNPKTDSGPVIGGKATAYKLSGPYSHDNLTIFLIHGEDQLKNKTFLTLQEALQQKKVIVHETAQVNELAIENISVTEEIFVQAGDIVKGGKQDRVIAYDLIVSAKSGRIPLASFCVEAGRWTKRGDESATYFQRSDAQAGTKDLKIAVRKDMEQGKVWENVGKAQSQLEGNLGQSVRSQRSATSLQLTLENKKLQAAVDAYVKDLGPVPDKHSDVIGFAFAVNGAMNSAEVYASNSLFKKLWPMLLKASAVEAISELKKGKKFKPVTAEAVQAFLADAEKGKKSEKEVARRVHQIQQETDKCLLFKCVDDRQPGVAVRKSYLAK